MIDRNTGAGKESSEVPARRLFSLASWALFSEKEKLLTVDSPQLLDGSGEIRLDTILSNIKQGIEEEEIEFGSLDFLQEDGEMALLKSVLDRKNRKIKISVSQELITKMQKGWESGPGGLEPYAGLLENAIVTIYKDILELDALRRQ